MNSIQLTSYLKANDLLLVDRTAFLNFMIEVNQKTKVDKRVLYITRKVAKLKYGLNAYWFRKNELDLKMIKGYSRTSTKKDSEQSILDKLQKQTEG